RLWLSISTHISTLVLGLSMLALPEDCSGDFGPRGLSVQDIRGCPSAHTGRPWHTQDIRVCLFVSISTHRTTVAIHQYTYQHVGPWTPHAGPSRGLFGTHRTSVGVRQHTQDVRGCLWLSVSTHRTSVTVHVCSCVTHRTSMCVRQHTQDVCGCPCVSVCDRQHTQDVCGLHTGRLSVSVSTHRTSVCVRQHTQDVRGCPVTLVLGLSTLTLPVDCSGDFGPRGLSVQYTQDVRGRPPAHTGRLWLSMCVCVCPFVSVSTHRTPVAVHQYTYQHVGPWTQHAGPSRGLFGTHRTSVGVRQHTQDVCGCLWLSVSTHRTSMAVRVCSCVSVGVRQHTQDVRGCPWLSVNTHRTTLVLGLSMLALPEDCSGDFGPPHTERPWVSVSTHRTSVAVRVCPCVSISTHRTSVAVHQYTYQHVGPWTQHAGPSRGLFV
ncbi:unnamed protein product, partial [Brassica rapa]